MTEQDSTGDNASATTEGNWEARWYDYGTLPDTVPEFNVALAKFLFKQAGVHKSCPEILRQEGGVHSYQRFVKVFNYSFPKLIEILGGGINGV